MKSIKQIREQFDTITGKKDNEQSKIETLAEAGFVESSKLSILKRAMNPDNRVLTPAERNAVMGLLESLIAQTVVNEELRPKTTRMSDMPSILVLKRKAIRIYPGGQNVGLYYSQQLDKYVAVPFGKEGREDRSVLSMAEETEINEVSNDLAKRVYAKRSYAAQTATDPSDKALNTYKAGKTLVNRMSVKGVPASLKMKKFANDYADAMNATQASSNSTTPNAPTSSKKNKKKKPPAKPELTDHQKIDREIRRGSVGKDVLNHYGKSNWVGHVIGRAIYRARNKAIAEQQIDENLLASAGKYLGKAGSKGSELAGSAMKWLRKGKKAKPPKRRPSPDELKQRRLDKLDKNRTRNARGNRRNVDTDLDGPNNNNAANSSQAGTEPDKVYSPTGGPAKIRVSASNSFDTTRKRQADLSWSSQSNQPQRTVRESLDLDGNIFELNSNVATKVRKVYESLNKTNKKKMIDLMNESTESFNKVITFAVRH